MSLRPAQKTALGCLCLAVAVLLVYGRVLGHEFVAYDTPVYLTENPWVLRGLSLEGLGWAFSGAHAANWHPLTWLSHMLDVQVLGLSPGLHALENVLLHALNACLVLVLLERLTGFLGRSLFVAALFALHPLHVESVAWVVERKDVLSTSLGLLCLIAWTSYARGGGRGAYLRALFCLALGLLAKSMLVTWPCVLLLLDFWPLRRRELGWGRLLVEKLPFFALSAASSVATLLAQTAGGAVQSLAGLPLRERAANALVAYAGYLGKTFWPAGLSFYYPHPVRGLPGGAVLLAAALLAGISAAAVLACRRAPWFLLGWLFFLGTLVPVIGIVQVGGQAMADRYTYVPLLGVFVALAWGAGVLAERRPGLTAPLAALALLACASLGILAHRQVGVWKDTRTLAEHALRVSPENHVAHDILGMDLLARGELERGAEEFRRALEIEPGDLDAASNLAGALQRQARYPEAEAALRRALARAPRKAELHRRLAIVLDYEAKHAEALAEVDLALGLDPSDVFSRHVRGIVLESLNRPEEAKVELERYLAVSPRDANVRMRLARLHLRRGELDAAEREIARAIAAEPGNAEAHRGRARVLLLRGLEAQALAELGETLRLSPEWGIALGDRAWILASAREEALRDPAQAVALGERAAKVSGGRAPGILDALAAAYAASRRFEEAIATGERAAARARETGDVELASRIERRLAAYREGRMDRGIPR